ncbi:MAG: hypothetical protein H8D34_15805 [Chloroflexi bacterium]|nr:hypothetical protein [Chloroflexota bacterium]
MNGKFMTNLMVAHFIIFAILLSGCVSTSTNDQASYTPHTMTVSTQDVQLQSDVNGATNTPSFDVKTQIEDPAPDSAVPTKTTTPLSNEAAPVFDPEFTPTATPIPTRQVPNDYDWKTLPIMPEIMDNVTAIYLNGIAQGRNPANFSVIGDCQAIPFVFMGPIGRLELLPGNHEQYLWDAIYNYEPSFLRESISVRGGFTAASIFNPMQADPSQCKPGETPLTCEYRLHNPAFIFITLENWRNPETIGRYESYLREILDYVISRGTVPILLTKADVSEVKERIHIINPAIAELAYEYDVPLVNFWRAAQNLENRGIDSEREGFHLSQDGFDLKNLLALKALYQTWQKIESDMTLALEQESTPTHEITATPTLAPPTPTPVPAVDMLAKPDCPSGCIFFGLVQSRDGDVELLGVFAYEYDNKNLIQILPAGFDLQDINPDGKHLLVNEQNFLYAIDLQDSSSELVSSNFFWLGQQSAYWAGSGPDADIIQIDSDSSYHGDTGRAIGLFPSARSETVFFESGSCESKDYCASEGIYQQLPNQAPLLLENTLRPVFSPDGNWYVFVNPNAATAESDGNIRYFLLQDPNQGIANRRVIYLPMHPGFRVFPDVRNYAFSPQSDKLFIYYDVYSAYFEKSLSFETYLLDLNTNILNEYGKMLGNSGSFKPKLVWSPDGQKILLFLTDKNSEEEYSLGVYETIIDTENRLTPNALNIYSSQNYFYLTNIRWQKP